MKPHTQPGNRPVPSVGCSCTTVAPLQLHHCATLRTRTPGDVLVELYNDSAGCMSYADVICIL